MENRAAAVDTVAKLLSVRRALVEGVGRRGGFSFVDAVCVSVDVFASCSQEISDELHTQIDNIVSD